MPERSVHELRGSNAFDFQRGSWMVVKLEVCV
jgi:hypothetical protein